MRRMASQHVLLSSEAGQISTTPTDHNFGIVAASAGLTQQRDEGQCKACTYVQTYPVK